MSDSNSVELDEWDQTLDELSELHNKKKADYSSDQNRFSNFEIASAYAGVTPLQVFETLLGVKQARLMELSKPGRLVHNESILDTYKDRAIYAILAYIYAKKVL